MEIKQEIDRLKKLIAYHNSRYYDLDSPEIPDYEYDKLYARLKELEEQNPQFIEHLFVTSSHSTLLMFTNRGKFLRYAFYGFYIGCNVFPGFSVASGGGGYQNSVLISKGAGNPVYLRFHNHFKIAAA